MLYLPPPPSLEQLSYSQNHYIHCNHHYLPQSAFWITSLSTNKVSLRHPGGGRAANDISSFTGRHNHFTESQCPSTSSPWKGCWPRTVLAKALIVVWAQWPFLLQHLWVALLSAAMLRQDQLYYSEPFPQCVLSSEWDPIPLPRFNSWKRTGKKPKIIIKNTGSPRQRP